MSASTNVERRAYRPKEAAEALGVTSAHVHNLIRRGELRTIKLGRCTLIPVTELDRIIEGGVDA